MTEKQFIEKNKADWKNLEDIISSDDRDPEELHQLFVKVSGDLSYAQTYFPRRSIKWYLNSLVNSVFDSMRIKPKISLFNSLSRFYGFTLPNVIIKHKYSFIVAFLIFIASLIIGIYSTIEDPEFPKLILGRNYVSMTEENISKGDPMAVYKSGSRYGSFIGITLNNVMVALHTYVFGIFAAIGSLFIMIYNGIMVGAFQTFFFNKQLLATSMLSIWIHGTIEISSIIIAGAAGLILGKSLIFPKTFDRLQSLRIGAVESVYVILSTIPLFVLAGFFEGYVTPQTDLPNEIKFGIIFLSAVFMISIYILRPIIHYRSGLYNVNEVSLKFGYKNKSEKIYDDSVFKNTMAFMSNNLGNLFAYILIPLSIFSIISYYWLVKIRAPYLLVEDFIPIELNYETGGIGFLMIDYITSFYFFGVFITILNQSSVTFGGIVKTIKNHFISISFFSIIGTALLTIESPWILMAVLIFFPWSMMVIYAKEAKDEVSNLSYLIASIKESFNLWGHMFVTILLLTFAVIPLMQLLDLAIKEFGGRYLSWHDLFEDHKLKTIFIETIFDHFFGLIFSIFFFLILYYKYDRILNKKYSNDLIDKINNFGESTSIT